MNQDGGAERFPKFSSSSTTPRTSEPLHSSAAGISSFLASLCATSEQETKTPKDKTRESFQADVNTPRWARRDYGRSGPGRPVARTLAGKAWCNNPAPANTPPGALTPILPSRKLARLLCAVRQPCYGKGHNRTSFFLIALHDLTIRETDATIHQPVLTSKLTI